MVGGRHSSINMRNIRFERRLGRGRGAARDGTGTSYQRHSLWAKGGGGG